jgi:hypothetical protein
MLPSVTNLLPSVVTVEQACVGTHHHRREQEETQADIEALPYAPFIVALVANMVRRSSLPSRRLCATLRTPSIPYRSRFRLRRH